MSTSILNKKICRGKKIIRRKKNLNPLHSYQYFGFQDRHFQPLRHVTWTNSHSSFAFLLDVYFIWNSHNYRKYGSEKLYELPDLVFSNEKVPCLVMIRLMPITQLVPIESKLISPQSSTTHTLDAILKSNPGGLKPISP